MSLVDFGTYYQFTLIKEALSNSKPKKWHNNNNNNNNNNNDDDDDNGNDDDNDSQGIVIIKNCILKYNYYINNNNNIKINRKRKNNGYYYYHGKDEPTEIQLGIYVISFYSISEQTMDYSVSMYFRQIWVDERLAYDVKDGLKNVTRLGEGSWETIWTPDIFLRNEKRASFHEVTVDNRLLTLNHTGSLWYVIK
ncbi:hypothetical protein HELRODRAFT_161728 [Helobdella robusta]|uniref:Neurotransmitter-gated ion-channel ligand-binding domain-containing protein n=1 Tax=Helobdella robusta TaxID=6412 RepID=T1ERU4_HELRO|nr:hypothetical protein HELRODRAFT_161728 [Helobdella robusta]ESO02457.1 hypothetical protein HELRODRAFT_161728 [Helobdella robusta]